jgi:tetratricopeptide (TPR) repeat protein
VSAQAAPKAPVEAPEAAPGDDDGWALLENLRRRLEDQAVQGRRTQQQVSQLAESIGALVEAQRRRSRWLNLNSFVAYLIFTMLCGAGFYFLYQSRADVLARARDAAQREREGAVRRADEAAARLAAREQADGRAWEVYQLLEAGKRAEAERKLAGLAELPLSRTERAILAARAHETQVMAVEAALKAAAASFKTGRHGDVIAPLEAAIASDPTGARSALARYYLGVAYAKGNQLEKAIGHLQAAVDGGATQDDARFQLASALDRGGAFARARAEYERYATAHPQSPLAVFAMRRAATLAQMPAVAPGAVAIPGGAAAPPGAPAVAPAGAAPAGGGVAPRPVPAAPVGGGVAPRPVPGAPAGGGVAPRPVPGAPAGGGVAPRPAPAPFVAPPKATPPGAGAAPAPAQKAPAAPPPGTPQPSGAASSGAPAPSPQPSPQPSPPAAAPATP